jgi:biotin synthase
MKQIAIEKILEKINNKQTPLNAELLSLIELKDDYWLKQLYNLAYKVKQNYVGSKVYFRGIIEFSNICSKNCFYCGIRAGNKKLKRFVMSESEIIELAHTAYREGYGSLVLQSGERKDKSYADFIAAVVRKIKKVTNNELGITLSLGEQNKDTLSKWFEAGAHRYLLRIETANRELYEKLHPRDHDFSIRLQTLADLKAIGYQVGTGVMIGLPGQSYQDLINDILFYKQRDIDMIGMGPYVIHKDTPLAGMVDKFDKRRQLNLSLKMIALTRLLLKDVNIAATTALAALDDRGREKGLLAGANVIMPNITYQKYRHFYRLYQGKPCLDHDLKHCLGCLKSRINTIGETIGYNQWGDSPHFFKRIKQDNKTGGNQC